MSAGALETEKFIAAFRLRRLGLLSDDTADGGRAVLVAPAEEVSSETVNSLISYTGGLIFVALSPARVNSFLLSSMDRPGTGTLPHPSLRLCVSVEAREGITTGISLGDRTATIKILGEAQPNPRKLVKPGHIFPVETRDGGVLVRNALPEGALDLVKIAGFTDAAVFVDLLGPLGELLGSPAQAEIARSLEIPTISLPALTRYRLETEKLVYRVAEAKLPTHLAGELRSIIYRSTIHGGEHLALVKGEISPTEPTLTRVQPEFTFGDVFGGGNPPTRTHLHRSLQAIGAQGSGVLVYLRRPDAGTLGEQIASWQDKYSERPAALMREYGLGAQILRDLGVKRIELLTGSRKNLAGLTTFGIEIVAQKPIPYE